MLWRHEETLEAVAGEEGRIPWERKRGELYQLHLHKLVEIRTLVESPHAVAAVAAAVAVAETLPGVAGTQQHQEQNLLMLLLMIAFELVGLSDWIEFVGMRLSPITTAKTRTMGPQQKALEESSCPSL